MGNCCSSKRGQDDVEEREAPIGKDEKSDHHWTMAEHKVFSKYLDSCYENVNPQDTVETKPDGSVVFKAEFLLAMYKRALFWNTKLFKNEKIRLSSERREILKV